MGYPEGVGKELLHRLEAEDALQGRICDPEKSKRVLEEMVLEASARLLYGTYATDALVADSAIKGIIAHNKSGSQAMLAQRTIDCSGDGEVAAYAGAPFEVGWQ